MAPATTQPLIAFDKPARIAASFGHSASLRAVARKPLTLIENMTNFLPQTLRKHLLRTLLPALLLSAGNAHAESAAPFLWQVQGPHAKHYLLGSVHLLPQDAAELPDGIAEAYDAAEGLVFESDIDALGKAQSTRTLLVAAKSRNGIKAEIDSATYAKLQNRIAKLGMPAPLCEQYKAWFCALSLEVFAYQRAGFSGDYGLDRQLYGFAHDDHKAIAWFEPPAVHLGLFTDMKDPLAKEFLAAALSDDGATGDEPRQMYKAWRDNDVAKLEGLVAELKSHFPEVYEHLLARRNQAWSARLKTYLDGDQSQLIVVGAAHWLGPDGLLARLKTAGYKIKPFIATDPEQITRGLPRPALITATALAGASGVGR
jgi:uncharacterized protein